MLDSLKDATKPSFVMAVGGGPAGTVVGIQGGSVASGSTGLDGTASAIASTPHDPIGNSGTVPSLVPVKKTSYAAMVGGGAFTVLPPVNQPSRRGDIISVRMDEAALQERLNLCQHSLIARLVHSKGDTPWKYPDLRSKLGSLWQLENWKLISLGKGFYQILLYTGEDKNRIWSMGSLSLKPGMLRLQVWDPDFNPEAQKATNAQVWVRLYGLNWVYWHPQILSDVARGIGVPLRIDNATVTGELGHYARILIDIDLSSKPPDSILLNREGGGIKVILHYENLPAFCSACNNVGHAPASCRYLERQRREPLGKQHLKPNSVEVNQQPADAG